MYYYKAIIQYDGTGYFGFQWQKDIPTIQNEINIALKQLSPGKITTMGSSRTDSGVHALEQFVKITSEFELPIETTLQNLNLKLPQQISILSFSPCLSSFKPTTGHKSKEYRYLFTNELMSQGKEQRFIANNPFKLNIPLMKECTQKIMGTHSFHNFFSAGSNVKSTVREILICEISEINPHEALVNKSLFPISPEVESCFQLKIVGKGFLKQMVRHLMSALYLVGSGKMSVDEFSNLLEGPLKDKRLWKVASARGLYLYKIE